MAQNQNQKQTQKHDKFLDWINYQLRDKEKKGHKWNVYMALLMIKRKWIELKPKQGARLFKRWLNSEIQKREEKNAKHQYYVVLKRVRAKYDEYFQTP